MGNIRGSIKREGCIVCGAGGKIVKGMCDKCYGVVRYRELFHLPQKERIEFVKKYNEENIIKKRQCRVCKSCGGEAYRYGYCEDCYLACIHKGFILKELEGKDNVLKNTEVFKKYKRLSIDRQKKETALHEGTEVCLHCGAPVHKDGLCGKCRSRCRSVRMNLYNLQACLDCLEGVGAYTIKRSRINNK